MKVGDWITLAVLAAVVVAIFLGRRHGKMRFAAAIASARLEGHSDAASEAAAIASNVLSLGGVHVNMGDGSRSTSGELPRAPELGQLNSDDALPAGVVAVRYGGRVVALVDCTGRVLWTADGELLPAADATVGGRGLHRDDSVHAIARDSADTGGMGSVPRRVRRGEDAGEHRGWDVVSDRDWDGAASDRRIRAEALNGTPDGD